MLGAWAVLVAGLFLLVIGGEALVRGSATVARRLGLSPLIIGLTLVGFGTSTPELATSVDAALSGAPDIAVGNVIGSNIANVLLILAAAALICPLTCRRDAVLRDGLAALGATFAVIAFGLLGGVGRTGGVLFLTTLATYVFVTYRLERNAANASSDMRRHEAELAPSVLGPVWLPVAATLAGIAAIVAGAALLVDGATQIARSAGISEAVIGLTLVAVGTSLPELTVSIIAAVRREADIAFGNIVGSNIFNVLGILGITAIIEPLRFDSRFMVLDVWVMLAAIVGLLVFAMTRSRLERWEGGTFLVIYSAYLFVLFYPDVLAASGTAFPR